MKESKSNFRFELVYSGHYRVTYTSPNTNKQWSALVTCMPYIDCVKYEDEPKQKDLNFLKKYVKTNGFKL